MATVTVLCVTCGYTAETTVDCLDIVMQHHLTTSHGCKCIRRTDIPLKNWILVVDDHQEMLIP